MEIALYRPEIPPNTGNIARLSICTGCRLHIVGEPSFSLDESAVRRAGIDYWHRVDLRRHREWAEFMSYVAQARLPLRLFTRFAGTTFSEVNYEGDEVLVFGRETSGLPPEVLESARRYGNSEELRIPVGADCRSLNLSNAVAVAVYEAHRQTGYRGLERSGPASS